MFLVTRDGLMVGGFSTPLQLWQAIERLLGRIPSPSENEARGLVIIQAQLQRPASSRPESLTLQGLMSAFYDSVGVTSCDSAYGTKDKILAGCCQTQRSCFGGLATIDVPDGCLVVYKLMDNALNVSGKNTVALRLDEDNGVRVMPGQSRDSASLRGVVL